MPVVEKLVLLLSHGGASLKQGGDRSTQARQDLPPRGHHRNPAQSACGMHFSVETLKDSKGHAQSRTTEGRQPWGVPARTAERHGRPSRPTECLSPSAAGPGARDQPPHVVPSPWAPQLRSPEGRGGNAVPRDLEKEQSASCASHTGEADVTWIALKSQTNEDKREDQGGKDASHPSPSTSSKYVFLLSHASAGSPSEACSRERREGALVGQGPGTKELKQEERRAGRLAFDAAAPPFLARGRDLDVRVQTAIRAAAKPVLAASEEEASEAVLVGDSPSSSALHSPPLLTSHGTPSAASGASQSSSASLAFCPEKCEQGRVSAELSLSRANAAERPAACSQLLREEACPSAARALNAEGGSRGQREPGAALRPDAAPVWKDAEQRWGSCGPGGTGARASNAPQTVPHREGERREEMCFDIWIREPARGDLTDKRTARCERNELEEGWRSSRRARGGAAGYQVSKQELRYCACAPTEGDVEYRAGSFGSGASLLSSLQQRHLLRRGFEGFRAPRSAPQAASHPRFGLTPREKETPSPLPSRRRPASSRLGHKDEDDQGYRDSDALGSRKTEGQPSSPTTQTGFLFSPNTRAEESEEENAFFSPLSVPRREACMRRQAFRDAVSEGDKREREDREVEKPERRDGERQTPDETGHWSPPEPSSYPSSCRSGGSLTNCSHRTVRDPRSRRNSLASSLPDDDGEFSAGELRREDRKKDVAKEEADWGNQDSGESGKLRQAAVTREISRDIATDEATSSKAHVITAPVLSSCLRNSAGDVCQANAQEPADGEEETQTERSWEPVLEEEQEPISVTSDSAGPPPAALSEDTEREKRAGALSSGQTSETSLSSFLLWREQGSLRGLDREIEDLLDSVEVFLLALEGDGHALSLRLLDRRARQCQARPETVKEGSEMWEPKEGKSFLLRRPGVETKGTEQTAPSSSSAFFRRGAPSAEPATEERESEWTKEQDASRARTKERLQLLHEQLLAFTKCHTGRGETDEREGEETDGGDRASSEHAEEAKRESVESPLSSRASLGSRRRTGAFDKSRGPTAESNVHASAHLEPRIVEGKHAETEQARQQAGDDLPPDLFGTATPPAAWESRGERRPTGPSPIAEDETLSHSRTREPHGRRMPEAGSFRSGARHSTSPLTRDEGPQSLAVCSRSDKLRVSAEEAKTQHAEAEWGLTASLFGDAPRREGRGKDAALLKLEKGCKGTVGSDVSLELPSLCLEDAAAKEDGTAGRRAPGGPASKSGEESGTSSVAARRSPIGEEWKRTPNGRDRLTRKSAETDRLSPLVDACTENPPSGLWRDSNTEAMTVVRPQESGTFTLLGPGTCLQTGETECIADEVTSGVLLSPTPEQTVGSSPSQLLPSSFPQPLSSSSGSSADPRLKVHAARLPASSSLPSSASLSSSAFVSSPSSSSCPLPAACASLSVSPLSVSPSRASCLLSRGVESDGRQSEGNTGDEACDRWTPCSQAQERSSDPVFGPYSPSGPIRQIPGLRHPSAGLFAPPMGLGAGLSGQEGGVVLSVLSRRAKCGESRLQSAAPIRTAGEEEKAREDADEVAEGRRQGLAETEEATGLAAQNLRGPVSLVDSGKAPVEPEGLDRRREGGDASTVYEGSAEVSGFPHTDGFFDEDPSDDIFSLGDSPAASGREELHSPRPASTLEEEDQVVHALAPADPPRPPSIPPASGPRSKTRAPPHLEIPLEGELRGQGAEDRPPHKAPADPAVSEPPTRPRVALRTETAERRHILRAEARGVARSVEGDDEGPQRTETETEEAEPDNKAYQTLREHCAAPERGERSPRADHQASIEAEPKAQAQDAEEETELPKKPADSPFAWWHRSVADRQSLAREREEAREQPEEGAAGRRAVGAQARRMQALYEGAATDEASRRPSETVDTGHGRDAAETENDAPESAFQHGVKEAGATAEASSGNDGSIATRAEASEGDTGKKRVPSPSPSLFLPANPKEGGLSEGGRVEGVSNLCASVGSPSPFSPCSSSTSANNPSVACAETDGANGPDRSAETEFVLSNATPGRCSVSSTSCALANLTPDPAVPSCVSPGEDISASIELSAMLIEASPRAPPRSLGPGVPAVLSSGLAVADSLSSGPQAFERDAPTTSERGENETFGDLQQSSHPWRMHTKHQQETGEGGTAEEDARLFFSPENLRPSSVAVAAPTERLDEHSERRPSEPKVSATGTGDALHASTLVKAGEAHAQEEKGPVPRPGHLPLCFRTDLEKHTAHRAAAPSQGPSFSHSGAREAVPGRRPGDPLPVAGAAGPTALGLGPRGREQQSEAQGDAGRAGEERREAEEPRKGIDAREHMRIEKREAPSDVQTGEPAQHAKKGEGTENSLAVTLQGERRPDPSLSQGEKRQEAIPSSPPLASKSSSFGPRVLAAPAAPSLNPQLFPPRLSSLSVCGPSSHRVETGRAQSPSSPSRPQSLSASSPAPAATHATLLRAFAGRRSISGENRRVDRAENGSGQVSPGGREARTRVTAAQARHPSGGFGEHAGRASSLPPQLTQGSAASHASPSRPAFPPTTHPAPSSSLSASSTLHKARRSLSLAASQEQPVADSPLAPPASPEETGPDTVRLGDPLFACGGFARAPVPPRAPLGREAGSGRHPGPANASTAAAPVGRKSAVGGGWPFPHALSAPVETVATLGLNGDRRQREGDAETPRGDGHGARESEVPEGPKAPQGPRGKEETGDSCEPPDMEPDDEIPRPATHGEPAVGASSSASAASVARAETEKACRSGSLGAAVRRLGSKCRVGSLKGKSSKSRKDTAPEDAALASDQKRSDALPSFFLSSSRLLGKKGGAAQPAPDSTDPESRASKRGAGEAPAEQKPNKSDGPSSGAMKARDKQERERTQKARKTPRQSAPDDRPQTLVHPAAQALPPPMTPRLSFQSARGATGGQAPAGSAGQAPGPETEFHALPISAHSRSLFRRFSFSAGEPAEIPAPSLSTSGAAHGLGFSEASHKGPGEGVVATKEKKSFRGRRFSLGRRHSVEGLSGQESERQ
ncbi:conserved hypothetical protein [Neospora caninum Liverpool]|nr:conserved hypothetical protein [Neospora caninum Liverpool]CBZ50220.1 conserved hypothetical protein [Neospora caninum Liverpool]|eukprot:XP_003880255.1 conserved hypothetical protein [Neospora caninum Liverpool]